jgi:hypothetical protein
MFAAQSSGHCRLPLKRVVQVACVAAILACDRVTGPATEFFLTVEPETLQARAIDVGGSYQCAMPFVVKGLSGTAGDIATLTAVEVQVLPTRGTLQVFTTKDVFAKAVLGFDQVVKGDRLRTAPLVVSSRQGPFAATVWIDYRVNSGAESRTEGASFECS